ncbi:hypothetical protein I79_011927 [Cricetulus griseus]|uniref:Uncharacterized protein n=1 Tax=Cricetulus griseus TaxID=10029 RepID=G3HMG6_CRIGR|nr:hypothetical protein I79_011927 [Cricetulus griseus]
MPSRPCKRGALATAPKFAPSRAAVALRQLRGLSSTIRSDQAANGLAFGWADGQSWL